MSKKLAAKASLIHLPPVPPAPLAEERRADPPEARIKTAPGSMAHFMATQSSAVKEADELRERLKSFDGAQPVRALDPRSVRASRWSNRHDDSYADAAFAELKAEIASAGGNVQPAAVRKLALAAADSAAAVAAGSQDKAVYELVFGHRRHRACLELGLPLHAMVVAVGDRELFESMERENRARKNLSAWEQGRMYMRALDEGLYPSQRKLSEALGVDVSLVSKSLSLARLPETVVKAFASPLDIQFRWAQPLGEALQRDPDGVIKRAAELRQRRAGGMGAFPASKVLQTLLQGGEVLNGSTPASTVLAGREGRQAQLTRDVRGGMVLRFAPGVLSQAEESELTAFVQEMLGRPG